MNKLGLETKERVLVTGGSGFVGRVVVEQLKSSGWDVRATGNRDTSHGEMHVALSAVSDWAQALAGCTSVVHLAGRAHVLKEYVTDPRAEFFAINRDATVHLAETAAKSMVKRFVFVSSIAVNGPMKGSAMREDDLPNPQNDYGASKRDAEIALREIGAKSGMEIVILRPPLVYGPGVRARFLQLLQWSYSGLPLPLSGLNNQLGLVFVDNLADAIATCLVHPDAAGQTFLVSDDGVISTSQLLAKMGASLGKLVKNFAVPVPLLKVAAQMVGKSTEFEKLTASIVLDTSHIRQTLNWHPPISMDDGLARTADWYLSTKHR